MILDFTPAHYWFTVKCFVCCMKQATHSALEPESAGVANGWVDGILYSSKKEEISVDEED